MGSSVAANLSFRYKDKNVRMAFPTLVHVISMGQRLRDELSDFIQTMSDRYGPITYIVDVGACIGTWTIPFALIFPEAKLLAIEPSKFNYPYLQYNCRDCPNVKTVRVAASSKKGKTSIAMPSPIQKNRTDLDVNTGLISVYGKSNNFREIVQKDTLDNLVEDRVSWLKIDVEGHEKSVLEGAKEILENHRPLVQVEIDSRNQRMAKHTTLNVINYILLHDYVIFGAIDNDWIFIPQEKA